MMKTTAMVVGFVAASFASTLAFNLDEYHDIANEQEYSVEIRGGSEDWIITAGRTALDVSDLTFDVDVTIDASAINKISFLKLYVGNDTDSDGTIESSEWELKATGSVSNVSGHTIGTISSTEVSATKSAYLLLYDENGTTTYQAMGDEDLEYEMP